MFRFLRYIILFILGYKIIKMVFAGNKSKQTVPPSPSKQNINTNTQNVTSASPKFNDAEFIDYEEVK